MPGTLLTPDCQPFCAPCGCRIYYEDCYIRWECNSEEVRVYRDSVLVSEDREGEVYRPGNGTWTVVSNGVTIDEVLINDDTFTDEQCPPIDCCDATDFARFQVSTSYVHSLFAEATDRDFRLPSIHGPVGLFYDYVSLEERIEPTIDLSGTYLRSSGTRIEGECILGNPVLTKIAEGKIVSEGYASGFRSGFNFNTQSVIQCPVEIETYEEGNCEIYTSGETFLLRIVDYFYSRSSTVDGSIIPILPAGTCREHPYGQESTVYQGSINFPTDNFLLGAIEKDNEYRQSCDATRPIIWQNRFCLPARYVFFWIPRTDFIPNLFQYLPILPPSVNGTVRRDYI